jgi:hypothetical protein
MAHMVERSNRRNAAAGGERRVVKPVLLVAGLLLPLAGCGSKPAVNEKNASVEEVSEKVREATGDHGFIQPGKWQSTVTIDQLDMPGMPPQVISQMKAMVAQTHASETCLTPEEVKQPKAHFFSGNENCRYDHFTMGKGKIDAVMRCEQGGSAQVMQMTGTYSPDSYRMKMQTTGGAAGKSMTMRMSVNAKRVGACTEKQS